MKRFSVVLICLFFILSGCTSEIKPLQLQNQTVQPSQEVVDNLAVYLLNAGETEQYSIGSGYQVLNVVNETIENSDYTAFPVYRADLFEGLLLCGEDVEFIQTTVELTKAINGKFAIIEMDDEILVVDDQQNGIVLMDVSGGSGMLKKINLVADSLTELSEDKITVDYIEKPNPSNRLVVIFNGEDLQKCIDDFCQDTGCSLKKSSNSGRCIFVMSENSEVTIEELLEEILTFDYVSEAAIDGINQPQGTNGDVAY